MKRILKVLLIATLIMALLTACGGSSNRSSQDAEQQSQAPTPIKLIAAHVNTEESSFHAGMVAFKEKLEELSGGTITVEIHPNGQLGGNENELVEKMATGTVDVIVCAPNFLAAIVKEADLFSIPYLFEDVEHWERVVTGEVGQKIVETIEAGTDFHPLGYWQCGIREYFGKKPITVPDDLKGVKIRVHNSETVQSVWAALGAQPAVLAYNELYSGLQNNVIDAAENDLGNILQQKFYEVGKYISMTNHDIATRYFMMSKAKYNSLNDEQKAWIDQAAQESVKEQWAYDRELIEKAKVELEKLGAIFNEVEMDQFIEKTAEVRQKAAEKIGVAEEYKKIAELRDN